MRVCLVHGVLVGQRFLARHGRLVCTLSLAYGDQYRGLFAPLVEWEFPSESPVSRITISGILA